MTNNREKLSVLFAMTFICCCVANYALASGLMHRDWFNVTIQTEDGDVLSVKKEHSGVIVEIKIDDKLHSSQASPIKVGSISNKGVSLTRAGVTLINGDRDFRRYVTVDTYDHESADDFAPIVVVQYEFSPRFGLCSVKVSDEDGRTTNYVKTQSCEDKRYK